MSLSQDFVSTTSASPAESGAKNDNAVFAGYVWENDLSDKEILGRLLKLNLERSRE